MRDRLREFSLSLHPDKTRLIEFGRFAAQNCKRRGRCLTAGDPVSALRRGDPGDRAGPKGKALPRLVSRCASLSALHCQPRQPSRSKTNGAKAAGI
jgi:hypothetical protein